MASRPFARRSPGACRACRINSVSSIICVKLRNRSSRRTGMPKPNSSSRCVGSAPSSEGWKSRRMSSPMPSMATLTRLSEAVSTFLKVSTRYWPGLLHCYDVADLPRIDKDLEQCFGSVRYSERRAWGRRGAIAGLVVRGPVRVVTALALRRQCFLPRALSLKDPDAWYAMRDQLTSRREGRRKHVRFRKDPAAHLASLEDLLLKTSLPS